VSQQRDYRGYELAYQEALRAITQQQAALESLRGRAGVLLAVAAIVTSFLGGFALGQASRARLAGDPSFPSGGRRGRLHPEIQGSMALPQSAERHHLELR
jgi:hypothetical protein